jgi:glycosyltransferase involved in cell wall biosynthesis
MTEITAVMPTFSGGGAEHVVQLIAEEALQLGATVKVVALYEPKDARGPVSGVTYVGLGAPNFTIAFVRLTAYFSKTRPERILSTLKNACIATEVARRLTGLRAIHAIRVANSYAQELARMSPFRRKIWTSLIPFMHRSAQRTIVVSEGLRHELQTFLPFADKRLFVIRNPVRPASSEELPSLPGAPGLPKIVMVGRLAPQKDHAAALTAFSMLKSEAELLIVGEGELREPLVALAERLKISTRVHFLGWRNDVSGVIAACDVLLLTSRFEGFPNVLIEAMSAGTAVVATDCPHGPSEIVTDPSIGELVPVGDAPRIAFSLDNQLALIGDPALRQQRRQKAMERYSVREATKQYLKVLEA